MRSMNPEQDGQGKDRKYKLISLKKEDITTTPLDIKQDFHETTFFSNFFRVRAMDSESHRLLWF